MDEFIPLARPDVSQDEIDIVTETIRSGWLTTGPKVTEFELLLSQYLQNNDSKLYTVGLNSCTSALFLALLALDIKAGDEVIVPTWTFAATAQVVDWVGATVVLCDIDEESLNIDVQQAEKLITKNTKAIIPVHIAGYPCDMDAIERLAKKYNLKIIEDSADTLGSKIKKKSTGTYSDISITSFYGSHIISCAGNGGMFLTNNRGYYRKANVLRSWGRMSSLIKDSENINKRLGIKLKGIEYDRKFVFSEIGYNFEPSEISASFGLIQLKKFKKFNKIRNRNFNLHFNFFTNYKEFFIQPKIKKNISTNFLAYPLILKENNIFSRKQLQIYLEKNKIQTRPIFSGNILRHPAFENLNFAQNKRGSFKSSDYIMRNGLLIGCHQGLTERHINYIHKIVNKFIKKKWYPIDNKNDIICKIKNNLKI